MTLYGNTTLALGYTSTTQQVRRISEDWVARNAYCLRCQSDSLTATPTNTKSHDFICATCDHAYELKSKRGVFSTKILDGAHSAMLRTIQTGNTPTFLLLEYSRTWAINGLKAIHHSLITETSIEPRKPLAVTARRAGWVGCNILLSAIAVEGQIPIIHNGAMRPRQQPREAFARLESLASLSTTNRTWAATILNFVHQLPHSQFALSEMYAFEPHLRSLFPNNEHIRPKIRQQLQVLRDVGLIQFLGNGRYEITHR